MRPFFLGSLRSLWLNPFFFAPLGLCAFALDSVAAFRPAIFVVRKTVPRRL
jgi:hypothetical protein